MRTLLTQKFCLMCNMQVLELGSNQIGDTGMISLADALGKGALPNLKQLVLGNVLGGNNIGDEGMKALAEAVSKGALAALETLGLGDNAIGDAGMSALAKAITPGPNGKGAGPWRS